MRSLAATAITLLLLAGSAAAFLHTQQLKLLRPPLSAPAVEPKVFAPTCRCPTASATLTLRLHRAGPTDVTVVDRAERPVRALATARVLPRGPARFVWDGRTDAGAVAANGRYRFEIGIRSEHRSIVLPEATRVDARPPRLSAARGSGGGRATYYRIDETAGVLARLGRTVLRAPLRPPGEHLLELPRASERRGVIARARDRAGNLSGPVSVSVSR